MDRRLTAWEWASRFPRMTAEALVEAGLLLEAHIRRGEILEYEIGRLKEENKMLRARVEAQARQIVANREAQRTERAA